MKYDYYTVNINHTTAQPANDIDRCLFKWTELPARMTVIQRPLIKDLKIKVIREEIDRLASLNGSYLKTLIEKDPG